MATWSKNRYSALFSLEQTTHKASSTTSSSMPDTDPSSFSSSSPSDSSHLLTRAKYEQNSSVFVASIPIEIPHEEILSKLSDLISQFIDPINVKLIDDKYGNKAAFVQAKSAEDARRLINSKLVLDGRLLRLELARAHRTLLISFLPSNLSSVKLRIVRGYDKILRVYVNESGHQPAFTPHQVGDPFSGSGHAISQFSFAEDSLRKLCELVGPLELFRKIPFDQAGLNAGEVPEDLESYHPHILLKGSHPEPGIWEVKWETREASMDAKTVISHMPGIRWTWAHNRKAGIHPDSNAAWYAPQPGYMKPFGYHQHQVPHSARGYKNDKSWAPHRPGPAEQVLDEDAAILDFDDFPPLSGGNPLRPNLSHQRTISSDMETPITPVSITHASPEIASANEEQPISTPNIPAISNVITPKQPAQMPEERRPPFPHQYDMTSLYVIGIPKSATDHQISNLFGRYGVVRNISRNAPRGGLVSSGFVGFEDASGASKVIQDVDNGVLFVLGNKRLGIKYRRINIPGFSTRGRGRFHAQQGHGRFENQGQHFQTPSATEDIGEPDATSTTVESLRPVDSSTEEVVKQSSPPGSIKPSPVPPATGPAETQSGKAVDYVEAFDTINSSPQKAITATPPTAAVTPQEPAVAPAEASVNATQIPAHAGNDIPSPQSSWVEVPQHRQPVYPYYPAPWATPYSPQWAMPYPVYPPPMYAMQPYSPAYWYPPPPAPVVPGTYPPHMSRPRLETAHEEIAHIPPPQAPKPPVLPAGSYQNPDGGITYIYPTEVIEKYMSRGTNEADTRNGERVDAPQQSTNASGGVDRRPSYAAPPAYTSVAGPPSASAQSMMHMPPGPSSPSYDVNPAIAAAVFANYPPLPPPVDRMPQASFVFNPQGVVQHVEPTGYAPGHHGAPGMGLVQAAAAAVANGYTSPGGMDIPTPTHEGYGNLPFPARYGPPMPSAYAHPQAMYGGVINHNGMGNMNPEYTIGPRAGGYRRRSSQGMSRPPYGPGPGRTGSGSFSNKPQESA